MTTPDSAAPLRICGKIARNGGGDRFSHDYCDALPQGHDGACTKRPSAERLAAAWSAVAPSEGGDTPTNSAATCDSCGHFHTAKDGCPECCRSVPAGVSADPAVAEAARRVQAFVDHHRGTSFPDLLQQMTDGYTTVTLRASDLRTLLSALPTRSEAKYAAYQQGHLDACKGAEGECVLRPDSTYPSYGMGWKDGAQRDEALSEAVRDLLWRVTPYGETEDGDVAHYIVTKGTVHRLVGAAQSAGISPSLRSFGVPETEDSALPTQPAKTGGEA